MQSIYEIVDIIINKKRSLIRNGYDIINISSKRFDKNILETPLHLQNQLILIARENKFNKNDYLKWLDESEQYKLSIFEKYEFGYCLKDNNDNYICYSFYTKEFYYFDHNNFKYSDIKNNGMSISLLIYFLKNNWL